RQSIANFLRRCGLPHANIVNTTIDKVLYSECYQEAISRNFPMDGKYSICPHMDMGVAMFNTYAHLPDSATKMWISMFTILVTYIDDMVGKGDEFAHVYNFYERFARNQPQVHPVLTALDALLRDVVCFYSSPVSNLIVACTLDYLSSALIDNETKDMKAWYFPKKKPSQIILTEAQSYPDYLRMLSGLPTAYSLFIFPSTVPLREYVQCMPDLAIVINHTNDILSYYKEEIEGETMNFLSQMAASRALTKQNALHQIIEKTLQAHHNIINCLKPHAEAHDAYVDFFHGFVIKFHAALGRYKLEEI
ncbi:isoprenoid synthase domain-containing protein, partial [Suillus spraguei]